MKENGSLGCWNLSKLPTLHSLLCSGSMSFIFTHPHTIKRPNTYGLLLSAFIFAHDFSKSQVMLR